MPALLRLCESVSAFGFCKKPRPCLGVPTEQVRLTLQTAKPSPTKSSLKTRKAGGSHYDAHFVPSLLNLWANPRKVFVPRKLVPSQRVKPFFPSKEIHQRILGKEIKSPEISASPMICEHSGVSPSPHADESCAPILLFPCPRIFQHLFFNGHQPQRVP